MSEKLTKKIAFKELQKFFDDTPFVLFGTGMSCAVDTKFGMPALEEKLKTQLDKEVLSIPQKKEWDKVLLALSNGNDFESAMNHVSNDELVLKIVKTTGDFVAGIDCEYSRKILNGDKEWAASSLFKKLVDGLSGTDRELHVATPNYDMLAEYAFSKAEISYINGFHGGVVRKLDWDQSKRSITYIENVPKRSNIRPLTRKHKHIALYKVHGSLNLFLVNDSLIENNSLLYLPTPNGMERLIITPGISKYEKLHQFRQELLGKFDNTIKNHNFFLFLGFGFNDTQLNTRIIRDKLKNQKCNGLIITKDTNKKIDNLLAESDNLWLVCQNGNDTLIKNKKYSMPLEIKNEELWKVDIFTEKILGG